MAARRVAVAASGGRDSTALLHCTAKAADALGVEVFALHVHHGLMPAADEWLAQVRAQSRRWGVAFACRRLQGLVGPGESVEAWARKQRYRALAEMAGEAGCGLVLLAHHRRDQAETWLLQALRGGGPAGLAAMPRQARRAGIVWARPWLDEPRERIEAYVRRHRLAHVEDSSNADPRYARSRLRAAVWSALVQAFPDAEVALAGAAAHAAAASALAAEVAAADLPALLSGGELATGPWRELTPARRRNALRAWLGLVLEGGAPDSLLARLERELPASERGCWPAPGAELRLYRGRLCLVQQPPAAHAADPEPVTLDLSQPGDQPLPAWGGHFEVRPADHGGAPPQALMRLTARPRAGGERFRLAPRAASRSLKHQFQARAIPAWQRQGPLLYQTGGPLIFVPGLGIDAGAQAKPGETQLSIEWKPDAAIRRG